MRIITPIEVAEKAGNKYLGVLVAAKFTRYVNDFPRDRSIPLKKKLTTQALEELASGALTYRLVRRRRQET
ncbi:DNA-directed RNA polymerase subunit omega [Gemmatimonadota bacterium]